MLGLDVCGFHSICSIYKAFGLVLLVAFRVLVASVYGRLGWDSSGVYSVRSVYGALAVNVFVTFTVFVLFRKCWGCMFV